MKNELNEPKSIMLQNCSRLRRQKLRYLALMALLVAVCWVGYWLVYVSSHEESELEKQYHAQVQERARQQGSMGKKPNPYLPRLNNLQRADGRGLGHVVHQPDVWKKPVKPNYVPGIRVHKKVLDDNKHFPNIVESDFSLSKQLGVPDEDLDTLKRKVVGNDALNPRVSTSEGVNKVKEVKQQHSVFGNQNNMQKKLQGSDVAIVTPAQTKNNGEMSDLMLQRFKQLRQQQQPSLLKSRPTHLNHSVQQKGETQGHLSEHPKDKGGELFKQLELHLTNKSIPWQKVPTDAMTLPKKGPVQPQKSVQKLPAPDQQNLINSQKTQNFSDAHLGDSDAPQMQHGSMFDQNHLNMAQKEHSKTPEKDHKVDDTKDQVHRIQQQIDILSKQIIEAPSSPDIQIKLQNLASLQQQLKQKMIPVTQPNMGQNIQKPADMHQSERNNSKLQYHQKMNQKQDLLKKELYGSHGPGPVSKDRGTMVTTHKKQAEAKQIPVKDMTFIRASSKVKKGRSTDKASTYTLVHSGKASIASSLAHSHLKMIPDHVPKESYIFQSNKLPEEMRYRPSIGNGHLGTVVHNKHIFLHGFYNGHQNQSHRAEIPSTVAVKFVTTDPPSNCSRRHILNTGEGVYSEVCTHEFYTVTERIFAHRTLPGLMVVEVDLTMEAYYPLVLKLSLNRWEPSYDMTFRQQELNMTEVSLKAARISAPETPDMTYEEVYVLYDHVPDTVQAPGDSLRTKWVFLTAIGASREEVLDIYSQGSSLIHSGDQLYGSHMQGWAELWQDAHIDITGNQDVARAVYGSWYYLLSSLPLKTDAHWPFVGLSPTGLSMGSFDNPQDFHGRVFVDQELWMFPPVLAFHPDLAKVLLTSRSRLQAKRGAAALALENGVESALRYPWQVGISGQELTMKKDPHQQAVYASGLISHAVLQYLLATNDTSLLVDQKYDDILVGIANYYFKQLRRNGDGTTYGLRGVQTPDDYARNVDNSAVTNAVAAIALKAPELASRYLGYYTDLNYHKYAEDIYIPVDLEGSYHKEHDSYRKGTPIHRADAVLLGYPLMWEMSQDTQRNDLERYEKVLDPRAPPTTWAMHTIGWLEVDEIQRADQVFARQFSYIRSDFQIWTEKATSQGACNYISAAGAYLQSIVHGYLGLRYHDDHLDIKPRLPPGTTEMHFVGIKFLGSSLDVWVWPDQMAVQVLPKPTSQGPMLSVYMTGPAKSFALVPGRPVNLPRKKARIFTGHTDLPDTL